MLTFAPQDFVVYSCNDYVVYCFFNFSIVTFTDVYVSYVIPKTFFNNLSHSHSSHGFSVTVCFIIPKPTNIDIKVEAATFDYSQNTSIEVLNQV